MLPRTIRHSILLLAMFRRGMEVRMLERAHPERPFIDLPDWLVGMLALTFRNAKQPAPQRTAKYAQAEWGLRRMPVARETPIDMELWRVTVKNWHDTELPRLMVFPAGTMATSNEYDAKGDRQFFLVRIPKGTSITVLDPENVRIERVI